MEKIKNYLPKNLIEENYEMFSLIVYEKLKEAEIEMNNTSKRYSKEEILESMNKIIDDVISYC